MDFENIEFETSEGVATLTLNRPRSLNSFTAQMHAEIRVAMRQVIDDASIRCLVITGAGRGFCAGQDLGDRAMTSDGGVPDVGASVEKNYNPLIRSIMGLPKPVICAVNGVAAGAGDRDLLADHHVADIRDEDRLAAAMRQACKNFVKNSLAGSPSPSSARRSTMLA